MDEDGVVGPPSGTHDAALVDVFDIAGLHRESVDDDGEVRHWLLQLESYFLGQCPISNVYTAQTFNENVIIKCRAVMIMILNDCDTSAISLSINPGQL